MQASITGPMSPLSNGNMSEILPTTSPLDLQLKGLPASRNSILDAASAPIKIKARLYEGGVIMTLVRWDPFRELEDMSERLNRVFSRPSLRNSGKENLTVADWMPTVDISETEGEYLIKAELPEVRKEDVKVTVENGVLTLQGERRQEKEEKGKKFHRVERSYGSFIRSFSLPESVDESAVKAEYKDGVLNLHLPKSEKVKPKAIDVKVA